MCYYPVIIIAGQSLFYHHPACSETRQAQRPSRSTVRTTVSPRHGPSAPAASVLSLLRTSPSPPFPLAGDYCNLPLYVKSEAFFRKPDAHEPCPVVPPREASIRNLARGYHPPARHLTLEPGTKPPGLPPPTSATTLPQRTLPMPTSAGATAAPTAAAAPAATAAEPPAAAAAAPAEPRAPTHSKVGGSRDSLLEMSTSGVGRSQKQGAGAYSKSYTLV